MEDEECEINTYSDFLKSNYFLSLSIIDHRNIEICLKNNPFTKKVVENAKKLNADNLKVIELKSISSDSWLSIWRQNNKGIY